MGVSKKVADRVGEQLKRYHGILCDAKNRDISESDTAVIIGDMLADIFGYKKYEEVTTEFAIRGTYVDLAIKVEGTVYFLIEVKAIGVELKDSHVKQAVDYGANQGIEWVILTNGLVWRIYKIEFKQPIEKVLTYELDLSKINLKDQDVVENIGTLTREGFTKSSMTEFFERQQAMSKFSLAAMLQTPPVLQMLRRELRRISPNLKVDEETLKAAIRDQVLKRELVEGDEAIAANDYVKKALRSIARSKAKQKEQEAKADVPVNAGGTKTPVSTAVS